MKKASIRFDCIFDELIVQVQVAHNTGLPKACSHLDEIFIKLIGLRQAYTRYAQHISTMKLAVSITIIFSLLISCGASKEVTMPFRNYYVGGERLMPLQQSDAKQCVRIWVSMSTSLDRIISIEMRSDSSFNGYLTTFGHKWNKNKKARGQFKTQKVEPLSGYASFFRRLDELDISSYKSQGEPELTLHQPYLFCIVETFERGKYHSLSFQLDPDVKIDRYETLMQLLQGEFPTLKFRK